MAKKESKKEVVVEEPKEEKKPMLTMIDSQGRNWEVDEKGTLLRRI
tara:strand:- start:544 stop:681 length:138 start_codon:yes stop_codon:yes gene_type:complete